MGAVIRPPEHSLKRLPSSLLEGNLGLKLGKSPKKAVAKANGRKNSSALGAEDFKMLKTTERRQ